MSRPDSSMAHPLNLSMTMVTIVLWGVAFPFIKLALDELPPMTLAAIRFAFTSLFLLGVQLTLGGGLDAIRALSRRQWAMIAAFGLFQTAMSNIAQNIGMQWTSAGLASIIQSVGPIIAVAFAIAFLGERYTHLKAAGGVLAIVGTVGIVTGGGATLGGSTLLGNVLMVVTALAYSTGGLIAKHVLRDVDPLTLVFLGVTIATAPLAVGAALESPGAAIASASPVAWGSVLFLGMGASGLAMALWYTVLRRVDLSLISYFVYLIPVISVALAWVMLGETLSVSQVLFAALLIAGVAVAQREAPVEPGAVVGATACEAEPCDGDDVPGGPGA